MKKILFVYPAMMMGGSTTSLLSILYNLDASKYDVTLALAYSSGEWMDDIPKHVKLTEPVYIYQSRRDRYIHRLMSPRYMVIKGISKVMELFQGYPIQSQQFLGMMDVDFYREIDEEYDVAISFLEGAMCKYVAKYVKAKKKITWIHVDYKQSRRCAKYDRPSLEQYDKIIHVSDSCLQSFVEMYPDLRRRCVVIENILSRERLHKLATEPVSISAASHCVNVVTACRITYYQKGIDRALEAINDLYNNLPLDMQRFRWYIIGDGPDYLNLKKRIEEYKLEKNVILLGAEKNPYKYYSQMDCFFLPSRYEGKPMAITEALILGLPVVVTEYSSAHEQIQDGIEGKIFDNTDEGTRDALEYILLHSDELRNMKKYISSRDYSNIEEMDKIEELLDEE